MKLSKLTGGGKVIVVAAVVLFVSTFLPLLKLLVYLVAGDETGSWEIRPVGLLFTVLPMLLGLLMAAAVVVPAVKPDAKLPRWGSPNAILGAGIAAAVLVVLGTLIRDVGPHPAARAVEAVGAVAAVALAVGGYLNLKAVNGDSGLSSSSGRT